MAQITIRRTDGEQSILGTIGEDVIKKALQCFLDHRAIDRDAKVAQSLLDFMK